MKKILHADDQDDEVDGDGNMWDGEARRPHAEARCRMTSNFHTMAKHHSSR